MFFDNQKLDSLRGSQIWRCNALIDGHFQRDSHIHIEKCGSIEAPSRIFGVYRVKCHIHIEKCGSIEASSTMRKLHNATPVTSTLKNVAPLKPHTGVLAQTPGNSHIHIEKCGSIEALIVVSKRVLILNLGHIHIEKCGSIEASKVPFGASY
jgi:hypothetical protein